VPGAHFAVHVLADASPHVDASVRRISSNIAPLVSSEQTTSCGPMPHVVCGIAHVVSSDVASVGDVRSTSA